MKQRFFVIFFLLACAQIAAAGDIVLSGVVSDAVTGEGLLGVNVQLVEELRGTSTDENGNFILDLPHAGIWTARISHVGYKAETRGFSANINDSIRIDVRLTADYLQVNEVLITAQARETTAKMSTTKVEIVRSPEIEQRTPGSLDKVLDAVPGVEVHRTGGAVVSNVSIRGSSDKLGGGVGNRTLLLVDGRPAIISDTDGANWWLYSEDIIERVEVVKGAYSALYGSNAMGGVVNVITKSPEHREVTRIHAGYGLYRRPPDWMKYTEQQNELNSLSFSHANTVGKFGYFANATRRASDGWRQSSEYDNISVFTKLKHDYSPTNGITFSTLYLSGENDYPHAWSSSLEPLKVRDSYTNDTQRKQTFSTDLAYRRIESPSSAYWVRFFYNRDLTRSLLNPASDPRENDVAVDFQTRSISQKFGMLEQTTRLLPYNNTLVFGVETTWDVVDGIPETHLYGQQQTFSGAVYAQDDYEPIKKFHFVTGARLDYRHVNGGKDTEQISPKAGVSYEFMQNFVGRATVGHAFRNPSIAEMFLRKVGTQDYEFEPNPDLNPETVNFGEMGISWWYDDKIAIDGAAFRYEYEDMIRWQLIQTGRYRTENLSKAQIQGFEIGIKTAWLPFGEKRESVDPPPGYITGPADFGDNFGPYKRVPNRQLRTSTTFTYLDTDIDDQGPLTYTPKWRFTENVSYEFGKVTLGAEVRAVAKTDTVIFYQNDAPKAYTLLDLRCHFQFHQNARMGFIVDNVTDEVYEEMERYRMPPRTYRVDLSYEFDVGKK